MSKLPSSMGGIPKDQVLAKMPDKQHLIKNLNDNTGEFAHKDQVVKSLERTPNTKEQLMTTLQDQRTKFGELDQQKLMQTMGNQVQGFDAEKKQLMQALAAQEQANGLLTKVSWLKDQALKCMNPTERNKMLQEAYDKEIEAHGQSKWAKRLQSGVWQGGMGGAGIGGGVGVGLGAVTGTVVGGVLSVPTTALGGLVGMGVGGITGPFLKLNHSKAKEVEKREKAKGKSDEEIAEAVRKEAAVEDEGNGEREDGPGQMPAEPATPGAAISQPEQGSAARSLSRQHSSVNSKEAVQGSDKAKKKPRKIEVRSGAKKPATAGAAKGK